MEFKEVVKNRYSCKKYSDRQVEAEKLTAILNAGRLAPTAKNLQEQRIYVLQSPEALEKIDAVTPCRYGAPTVLVVAFNSKNVFTYPGGKRDSGVEDATIVASHMILAAADEGVVLLPLPVGEAADKGAFGVVDEGLRAEPGGGVGALAIDRDRSIGGGREA